MSKSCRRCRRRFFRHSTTQNPIKHVGETPIQTEANIGARINPTQIKIKIRIPIQIQKLKRKWGNLRLRQRREAAPRKRLPPFRFNF